MKIFYSPTSPYVRKCLVVARELGLSHRIELLPSKASPVDRDPSIIPSNPLGKIPTFITDDGVVLFDSRVICEFLNALGGGTLFPANGAERWRVLTEQSLGDGILDAAILARYEVALRPEPARLQAWLQGQLDKIDSGLREFEAHADRLKNRVDIGTITLACALGYLDLRFNNISWRSKCPQLKEWFATFGGRPSMQTP